MNDQPGRWQVFLPDPWVWEGWMLEALEAAGCDLTLGAAADDPDAKALSDDEMGVRLASADGVVIHSRERITAAALSRAGRLRVVAKMGIGVERIDIGAATAAGVLVTNTPVAENYQGLAEGTIAFMLALLKRLPAKERLLSAGGWRDRTTEGELLSDQTIGIVGLGRVGRRVADLLRCWPVRLLAADPNLMPAEALGHGAELVPLAQLLASSTVVSLHVAPRAGDPPIIGRSQLAQMRPGSYLINTARGSLVDEAALVQALETGSLAGAALDVFDAEPLPADHPLRTLKGVILTPHSIGTSRASQRAICRTAVECCLAALGGQVPEFVVNPEAIPLWRQRVSLMTAASAT